MTVRAPKERNQRVAVRVPDRPVKYGKIYGQGRSGETWTVDVDGYSCRQAVHKSFCEIANNDLASSQGVKAMRLDRNLNGDGRGKYGLILSRKLAEIGNDPTIGEALHILEQAGVLDWADTPETEVFVMRIKDRYAGSALSAYAASARIDGNIEYAKDVAELGERAGLLSQFCKRPD